jgi:thiamine-monophosphate kinase
MNPDSRLQSKMKVAQPTEVSSLGEREWLRLVRGWFGDQPGESVLLGIGDDAAALRVGGLVVVSTDALIEGVHFRREWLDPEELGAKALAVNLSDLAAMAAAPTAAFLSLGVPPETDTEMMKRFFDGFGQAARQWECPLAGGDLTRAPQWVIAVTVLGRPAVSNRVVRRSTAVPGQILYATGWPGESGAGRAALENDLGDSALVDRHIRPTPRLREAAILARACPDLAMIDVSDGIWNDAGQIAEASGVRVELERDALPISSAMADLAHRLNCDPFDWMLFGGEDYELLFASRASLEAIQCAFMDAGLATPIHAVGRVAKGNGLHLMNPGGDELPIQDQTFRHF